MLPNHAQWGHVLGALRYVVIDEAHMYRGIFGAHVALVLRRLRRLAALYGAAPRFVCCSATLGNPRQLFCQLTGLTDPLVLTEAQDGSPHGRRTMLLWNPPPRNAPTPLPPGKGVPLEPETPEDGGEPVD